MTTMMIIRKCRERYEEIPSLVEHFSRAQESARVNAHKLEELLKEKKLLSKLLEVIVQNDTALPEPSLNRPSYELKEQRMNAFLSVPDISKECTGKHDLTIVTEYMSGKRPADIAREIGISSARVLDILDNVKRRCIWHSR